MIARGRGGNVAPMNTPIYYDVGSTTLGKVLVAQARIDRGNEGIHAILLGDTVAAVTRELRERFPESPLERDGRRVAATLKQVIELADGERAELDLPLAPAGTAFQQRVWRALRRIPAGTTASYSDIARRIDAPTSFRAVAQACGANPLALAIPCHRVVRGDGALSGYRWGVARKRALLEREAAR